MAVHPNIASILFFPFEHLRKHNWPGQLNLRPSFPLSDCNAFFIRLALHYMNHKHIWLIFEKELHNLLSWAKVFQILTVFQNKLKGCFRLDLLITSWSLPWVVMRNCVSLFLWLPLSGSYVSPTVTGPVSVRTPVVVSYKNTIKPQLKHWSLLCHFDRKDKAMTHRINKGL